MYVRLRDLEFEDINVKTPPNPIAFMLCLNELFDMCQIFISFERHHTYLKIPSALKFSAMEASERELSGVK